MYDTGGVDPPPEWLGKLLSGIDDFDNLPKDLVTLSVEEREGGGYRDLRELLRYIKVEEAVKKGMSRKTVMIFIGIQVDSIRLIMEVDEERLKELMELLPWWMEKSTASRKVVESLIGTLSFVAKCVRASRIFLARMLAELKFMPQEAGQHVRSAGFKADVYWWHRFMAVYNGVSLIFQ